MAKAEIIEYLGSGKYKIKRIFSGRDIVNGKKAVLGLEKLDLEAKYATMPEDTEDQILDKNIVKLQIKSLEKKIAYLNRYMPADEIVEAYCADFSESLTGVVGTIDISGEYSGNVNIVPGYSGDAAHDVNRDGNFYPAIAMGPWTTLLNRMIFPGWQKWRPTYRYATIVAGSIDHVANTCSVVIQSDISYSSQQNLYINQVFDGKVIPNVPFEYMNCNSHAFMDLDQVIIKFASQNWANPKVVGFKENPGQCGRGLWSMFGGYPYFITAYRYQPSEDTWLVFNDPFNKFEYQDYYYFYVPAAFNWEIYSWDMPSEDMWYQNSTGDMCFPIVRLHEPFVTNNNGIIYVFGGWFNTGEYLQLRNPTAFTNDTCQSFDPVARVWSRVNKDQFVGRSYGFGCVLNGKHHLICGADYDNRLNSFYPHVDLDTRGYEYGDKECYSDPPGPGAVQTVWRDWYSNFSRDQDWHEYFGAERDSWNNATGTWFGMCGPFLDSGGAHSYPPPAADRLYALGNAWNYSLHLFFWVDGSVEWGRRWYENPVLSENLQFDDVANSYSQKGQTQATMMMAGWEVAGVAYIAGGTTEEIADLIYSGDASGMTDSVRAYTGSADTWAAKQALPEKLLNPSGFSINGKGYVFSGYSFNDQEGTTGQDFGREPIYLNLKNCHPESVVYRCSGLADNVGEYPGVLLPQNDGILPGEIETLHCTNNVTEYNPAADVWTEKQRASTPTGNCRYREYWDQSGSVTNPYKYGFDADYFWLDWYNACTYNIPTLKVIRLEQDENPYTDHYEVENPGPYIHPFWSMHTGRQRGRKLQHLYRYPAHAHDGIGYLTSGEHVSTGYMEGGRDGIHIRVNQFMSGYNPITDSHSIKEVGIKEHLSGGMTSL